MKCLEVPSWLGRLFGDPGVFCISLDEIDEVHCFGKLEILRGAKALGLQKHLKVRSLTFDSEPVSDAELELLRDPTGLEEIHFGHRFVSMEVTDAPEEIALTAS